MPRSSLHPYLFLSQLCKQVSIPSEMCTYEFQSHHPLAVALSLQIWGTLFSATLYWFRETRYTGSWWTQGRHTPPREWFLHESFREAEACGSAFPVTVPFSSKHLPQLHACLGRSPQSSISFLLILFPPAWLLPPLFQISWQNPLLFQSALISNARPGTYYVTSYLHPPMMCYFCQFPCIFYLLSVAIFSQSKTKNVSCSDMQHPLPLAMSQVTRHS